MDKPIEKASLNGEAQSGIATISPISVRVVDEYGHGLVKLKPGTLIEIKSPAGRRSIFAVTNVEERAVSTMNTTKIALTISLELRWNGN